MLEILAVDPGSIAAQLDVRAGDHLVAVNGRPVRDLIDYLVAAEAEQVLLEIEKADGERWELDIEHPPDETLGLVLPHPEPAECGNQCIFCFVHQLPRGMRRTLYVKDEDYRFSYLYGAYVTLTNLDAAALERIVAQQLSPLYVSVHATDEAVRRRLLGRSEVPPILDLLRELADGGIELHTQVVVCPGINDGEILQRTFADLAALAPAVHSLAIVPVGLTGHRRGLPPLRPLQADEARDLVDWVHRRQAECLSSLGTRLVFAADELYLQAGSEFPPLEAYEDLPQIENGVGMVPLFRQQAEEVMAEARPLRLPPVSVVTGRSAAGELDRFVAELADRCGVQIEIVPVDNRFFGGQVSVTGLLTGKDLLEQLTDRPLGQILLLPEVMLREGEAVFLDDLSVKDLAEHLGVEVEVIPADPWGLWDMLETIAAEIDPDQVDPAQERDHD